MEGSKYHGRFSMMYVLIDSKICIRNKIMRIKSTRCLEKHTSLLMMCFPFSSIPLLFVDSRVEV